MFLVPTIPVQDSSYCLGVVISGYQERLGFGTAFDFAGEGVRVRHNSAQNLMGKNPRDTMPIRPVRD